MNIEFNVEMRDRICEAIKAKLNDGSLEFTTQFTLIDGFHVMYRNTALDTEPVILGGNMKSLIFVVVINMQSSEVKYLSLNVLLPELFKE